MSVQPLEIADDGGAGPGADKCDRAAESRPHVAYRVSSSHDCHRWREPSLGRTQPAVVVAGCFMQNKTREVSARGCRVSASIVKAGRAAPRLDVAAALLAFQSALLRTQRRPGSAARGRPDRGF